MYNVLHDGKLIARIGRKSGVGVTFHFPFDEENGYQLTKIDGDNYHTKKV
jgi:hypothetical protein